GLSRDLSVCEGTFDRLAGAGIRSLLGQAIAVRLIAVGQAASGITFGAIRHAHQPVQVVVRIGRRFRFTAAEIALDFYLGQSVAIHVVAIAVAGEWRFPCTRWTIDDPLDTVGAVIGTRITPVADRTVRVFDILDET